MPSLKQLKEFKISFLDIGREAAVLAERHLPDNDLSLPDSEPAAPPEPAAAKGPDVPQTDAAVPALGDDGFDFGTFLDTIPDDLSVPFPDLPDIPEIPEQDTVSESAEGPVPPDGGFSGAPPLAEDDGLIPDTLLRGLGDDGEAPTPDSGDFPADLDFDLGEDFLTTAPEDEAVPAGDLPAAEDEGSMPEASMPEAGMPEASMPEASMPEASMPYEDFSLPDMDFEEEAETEAAVPAAEEPSFDLSDSGEEPFSLFSEDSVPSSGADSPEGLGQSLGQSPLEYVSDTEPAADGTEQPPAEAKAPDSGNLNIAIPETEADNIEIPLNFDSGEDSAGPEPEPADAFEDFSLEPEAAGASFGALGKKAPAADAGEFSELEEFSLTGLGEIDLSGTGTGTAAAEEVEEIQLDDQDLVRLQETLAAYPLNLRVACEEIISEQAVAPNLMSSLIKLLVTGAPAKETASLTGKILGRTIPIPKGFEKKTGEALEIEQASFSYIFVHKFLPVLRLVVFVTLVAVSLFYLSYRFIYIPMRADSIYRAGYERIEAGEFARANERFSEAFRLHQVKNWFYRYAEAFRDMRQYIYAEEKYDELLRYYPQDKKGALDYADMETTYLNNYSKADSILRRNILDYAVDDKEALLALGDTNLAWGEIDPSRYDEARRAYARLLERYGWQDPIVERMMKYFIRTDDLGQVLPLQDYFLNSSRKRTITPETLAELGGYLLDKRFEEVRGVPDENISRIDGIRDILLRAVTQDPALPEAHYHLARYYSHHGSGNDERETLKRAVDVFDAAPEKSAKRVGYRIDAVRRYAQVLIANREFFSAEEQITTGINLYEDGVSRRLISPSPEFGRLYADLGDLEYFTKDGNMAAAIQYYSRSERNGWAPPEIQYRMGSAYYHLRQWAPALERFFAASVEIPLNRRLLHALGNASSMRGDYYTAQGYYNRLVDVLNNDRAQFTLLTPHDRPEHMELAERLMVAQNNLGVTMEALAEQTGNNGYRSRALGLYAESARAWDAITRNPATMVRAGAADLSTPGVNLAYLNSRNTLNPVPDYEPQIYLHIDKDVLEPSLWETLAPADYRLSDEIDFYR
jgi:tetratricopeptide (TPR) repeat protein